MTKQKNKITDETRRRIADEMSSKRLFYHGDLRAPYFLARLFDLQSLPSNDRRYNNAYDDIYQHMVNNSDWDDDWIYSDPRINLTHCEDEIYLKFLAETIHPKVRTNVDDVSKLVEIYNKNINREGYEIIPVDEISGKPVFCGRQKITGQANLFAQKAEIKKYLNTAYVNGKINIMTEAINKDTDLAIGTAKELLETACKSILKQKGVLVDTKWPLPQLLKTTNNNLDFLPKEAEDPQKAEKSITQILSGISSIVHGVSELRNSYGTGHGKNPDFKPLDVKYAKLLVGVVSAIVILYLSINGETTEIVGNEV